jgi:hypothetical protein
MTTADLIARLASDDGMDAPLFREVVRACGVELDPDDDRLARLMEMILVGAWRDACAELQAVVLPGTVRAAVPITVAPTRSHVIVYRADVEYLPSGLLSAVGTHPTSECRAHLIAILRAREAQG